MQDQQYRREREEEGRAYLEKIKYRFGYASQVYQDFLTTMINFKERRIDTVGVIQTVSYLLRGHPDLISGFSAFLPHGYYMPAQPDEQVHSNGQVIVSIPIAHLGGRASSTGPTSLTLPGGPPSISPLHNANFQAEDLSRTTSPPSSNGYAVKKVD